jgi:hypothetical protein
MLFVKNEMLFVKNEVLFVKNEVLFFPYLMFVQQCFPEGVFKWYYLIMAVIISHTMLY